MSEFEKIKQDIILDLIKRGYDEDNATSLVEHSGIDFMYSITPEIILNASKERLIDIVLK